MEYNLMLNKIISELHESISYHDAKNRTVIFNSLYFWYLKNYSKEVENACLANDQLNLIKYAFEIEKICNLSDEEKLRAIINDSEFNELINLSSEIFGKVKNKNMINVEEYEDYINKLNILKNSIDKQYIKESEMIISECILDLDYLRNNGDIEKCSSRYDLYCYKKKSK